MFSLVADPNAVERSLEVFAALIPGAALMKSYRLFRGTGAFSTHSRFMVVLI